MSNVQPSRSSGFSLIELVLVSAILAIFGAMAMPRIGSAANSNRAKVAAQKVVADLAMMRLTARASSANASITYSATSSNYTLTGMARTGGTDPVVALAGFPYGCTLRIGSSGTPSTTVTFSPTGLPNAGVTLYVGCGTITRAVVLDAATGAATVQ